MVAARLAHGSVSRDQQHLGTCWICKCPDPPTRPPGGGAQRWFNKASRGCPGVKGGAPQSRPCGRSGLHRSLW